MYNLITSFVKHKGYRTRLVEKNISDELVREIVNDYTEVKLVLSTVFHTDSVVLDFLNLPKTLKPSISDKTLIEFIEEFNSVGLPLSDKIPTTEIKHATFSDAFRLGFDIELKNPNTHPQSPSERKDKTDLILSIPNVDYKTLHDYTLFSVNGFLHRGVYTPEGIVVHEGSRTLSHSGKNHLGLWDFSNIGKVTQVPIYQKDICAKDEQDTLSSATYIRLTDQVESVEGKTLLLSLGGYLVIPGVCKGVFRVSDRIIKIEFKDFPFARRYFESLNEIDLEPLERYLDSNPINPTQVSLSQLYDDCVIHAYCRLAQSFFILIDNDSVVIDYQNLESTGLNGKFVSHTLPKYPVVTDSGLLPPYWYKKEGDRYSVSVEQSYTPNYLFETTSWKDSNSIDASRIPSNLGYLSNLRFIKLGSVK